MKTINKFMVKLGCRMSFRMSFSVGLKTALIAGLSLGLASCASVADVPAKNSASPVVASATGIKSQSTESKPIYRVRLFFGLSLPTGGGVSLKQWQDFQQNVIAKTFDGFNVVDSTGFYKSEPERSKVVTIIVTDAEMDKVRSVASQYAAIFKQDSVMMVKVKVDEWAFIGPDG